PLRWTALLSDELATADGFERLRANVARIEPDGRSVELVLDDDSRISATHAVICAGNGSAALVASAGGALPLVDPRVDSAAFGYLADVSAPGHRVDRVVTTDDLGMRPGDDDLLLVQALDLDRTAEVGTAAPPGIAIAIEQRIAALLPH